MYRASKIPNVPQKKSWHKVPCPAKTSAKDPLFIQVLDGIVVTACPFGQ